MEGGEGGMGESNQLKLADTKVSSVGGVHCPGSKGVKLDPEVSVGS